MTNVISVRFRGGCKTYYFDPRELTVQDGDDVIVETNQGLEFVHCTQGNHPVADSMVVQPLRPVLRLATENDRRTAQLCRQKEKDAFRICQKKIDPPRPSAYRQRRLQPLHALRGADG